MAMDTKERVKLHLRTELESSLVIATLRDSRLDLIDADVKEKVVLYLPTDNEISHKHFVEGTVVSSGKSNCCIKCTDQTRDVSQRFRNGFMTVGRDNTPNVFHPP
jgi:hypothetical protein